MAATEFPPPAFGELPSHGHIRRVLWLHRTDRWYFGDFLRHASWLTWLRESSPQATIDLASHPAYLPVYGDARFADLLDARSIGVDRIRGYDLVIEPSAGRPTAEVDAAIPMLLSTWDTGWELRVAGVRCLGGSKDELNYFRAAHPSTLTGSDTVLPSGIRLTAQEVGAAGEALNEIFPGGAPVVVYNPTASNVFTRDTDLAKEVDNALSPLEHASVLERLLVLMPGHLFLVGSALKPGDAQNADAIWAVTSLVKSERVTPITALDLPGILTLRGFAALLACPRVCSSTGSGTGTNTHLASLLGVPALSIERGADAQMRANWDSNAFGMGSFRWRNPHPCTGIHVMDWSSRSQPELNAVADAFVCEHAFVHDLSYRTLFTHHDVDYLHAVVQRFRTAWPSHRLDALDTGRDLLAGMRPTARAHFGDFRDEAAYLALKHGIGAEGFQALIDALRVGGDARLCAVHLFQDSNLHKLFIRLANTALSSTTRDSQGIAASSVSPRSATICGASRLPGWVRTS